MAKFLALLFSFIILASVVFSEVMGGVGHDRIRKEQVKNAQKGMYGQGSLRTSQCPGECTRRCSKTQYHKPCMFFCQKCCRKCLCVPPGFYGNKHVCSCYNNWKTKRGGPKCP
ncbi:hypothetical protein LUZ61_013478 [Rhynchospora tenuis]|uniref:Gibberellin-regulated protein 6 n=1 Tax=Rhynchospora tenuis TaxID=198213 RepID=A0AAD5W9M0_9POAL|nr:hypothetical protein LUZ61_013478 [Rhynchospora tenuis]